MLQAPPRRRTAPASSSISPKPQRSTPHQVKKQCHEQPRNRRASGARRAPPATVCAPKTFGLCAKHWPQPVHTVNANTPLPTEMMQLLVNPCLRFPPKPDCNRQLAERFRHWQQTQCPMQGLVNEQHGTHKYVHGLEVDTLLASPGATSTCLGQTPLLRAALTLLLKGSGNSDSQPPAHTVGARRKRTTLPASGSASLSHLIPFGVQ